MAFLPTHPTDAQNGDLNQHEAEEPELEALHISEEQKLALKRSWRIIYAEMGSSLSYVGGSGNGQDDGGVAETFLR